MADHVNEVFAAPRAKLKLMQAVFYMKRDKVETGRIQSRIIIEHSDEDVADLQLIAKSTALFISKDKKQCDSNGNYYITKDGIFSEEELFANKEELLDSL